MHEESIPHELQNLHPVSGEGRVPHGWLRSIDRACTAWLWKRGLLGSEERRVSLGVTAKEEEAR